MKYHAQMHSIDILSSSNNHAKKFYLFISDIEITNTSQCAKVVGARQISVMVNFSFISTSWVLIGVKRKAHCIQYIDRRAKTPEFAFRPPAQHKRVAEQLIV